MCTRVGVLFRLVAYYGIARHLPASNHRLGRFARPIRAWICRGLFKSAGRGINIERGAYFGDGHQIEIGDYAGIGVNCQVWGPVRIGSEVVMGPEVVIITRDHRLDDPDVPIRLQGYGEAQPVVIGDNSFIGQRVIILPGVKIGRDVIVGAGAVVTRDVPDYAIVGGNPARVIRMRTQ
jgi:maltose O-acetyltransferase